jgi:sugar phosphate isomerase/epimerase
MIARAQYDRSVGEVGLLGDGLPGRLVVAVAGDLAAVRALAARETRRVLARNTTESPAEWRAVMDALGPELVGFALDLGWAHRSAARHVPPAVEEPARAFLRWADRVEAVVLHDATEARVGLPLGRGDVAWRDLAAALRDAGVRAPLLLDVEGDPAQSRALAGTLCSRQR